MANCGKDIALKREGTDQQKRFLDALSPGSVKLNNLGMKEWMQFAYNFAGHLNYFSLNDDSVPTGDWKDFFKKPGEIEGFIKKVEGYLGKAEGFLENTEGNITPHLALYVAFIKLLEFTGKRFNGLTQKHIDFYYEKILGIEKLPPSPDKVHVIFELAKNSVEAIIEEGTPLDGDKDSAAQKLIYKTEREFIANQIKVSQIRNLYNDLDSSKLKASEIQAGDESAWWPFGQYNAPEYEELPDAKVGFALASDVLEMKEGERNVCFTIEFKNEPSAISVSLITNNLEIWCSGEKGWLGPFKVEQEVTDFNDDTIFTSGLNASEKKLRLAFRIPKDEAAVYSYNKEVHGESFNTSLPVCRVLIKTNKEEGHFLYSYLSNKEIKLVTADIDVRRVESLELESDAGPINASKPFYLFGTRPQRGSDFYIGYPELFKKEWNNIDVEIDWKNTPLKSGSNDAFEELYSGYVNYDIDDSYFTVQAEIRHKEEWMPIPDKIVTLFEPFGNGFAAIFNIENSIYKKDVSGKLRISLNQSFLHELYPKVYAQAIINKGNIPNEPYTPLVDSIRLSYTATAVFDADKALGPTTGSGSTTSSGSTIGSHSSTANSFTFFHEHPFGQSEEGLSKLLSSDNIKKLFLLPNYSKGGELYIGLENVLPLQQVPLLIQVIEGSENPTEGLTEEDKDVEWAILINNEWKYLNSDYMIINETDNFLKSGIVRFSVPNEVNNSSTLLPQGLVWIRAKNHKNYDSVCKAIAIYAQAVTAQFSNNGNGLKQLNNGSDLKHLNNGNDFKHLKEGLEPGSISKLVNRVSTVKGVSQPFSSFGGAPRESGDQYYRRVSERLRHKNRAISIWDYEHIILQQFPQIHKVKCLSHSCVNSFLAPGEILLIVIPDIVNKNVFDIYQPRVSKALLNEIQNHINKLNSFFVNAVVQNPDYEPVTVELNVKFYDGFDESYYLKRLKEDITRLLSPWAFEKSAEIRFGATLHRSEVINWVEELNYVDYVTDVKLHKGDNIGLKSVTPNDPKSILVSAKQHFVSTKVKSCTVNIET